MNEKTPREWNKICNVKGCYNRFTSAVWYICEEHRENWGWDKDGKDPYEYKIDDPEKYYNKGNERL